MHWSGSIWTKTGMKDVANYYSEKQTEGSEYGLGVESYFRQAKCLNKI